MGLKRTDEFRKDAVRIALTSGLVLKFRDTDIVSFEPKVTDAAPCTNRG
ncbi:hypothetical protein GV827_22070 [Sulfitobacter sp. JBTF-M27]|uniref:Uncharacterized protein n=1 Tax=Sulfitobacter sediminilitoris TaxID=2698830 RepID=A0A6P0CGJ7_9RHOB|nr:hypothetical protein [Sulfitobacter sediminilitoris]